MKVILKYLKKIYKKRTVLNIGELEFESGKVYAVLGPNGAGKSTMLKIIAGIDEADSGEVIYGSCEGEQSACISYLPQKPYIFDFTVLENVTLGMGNNANALQNAKEALNYVGMADFIDAKANSLSGGEAQRVAVARTLVLGRKLVLMDEPASSADISSMRMIEDYIKLVNKENSSTVVFTTHNPSQAYRTADEVIMLWAGEVIEKGEASKVMKNPERKETKEFLENWRL